MRYLARSGSEYGIFGLDRYKWTVAGVEEQKEDLPYREGNVTTGDKPIQRLLRTAIWVWVVHGQFSRLRKVRAVRSCMPAGKKSADSFASDFETVDGDVMNPSHLKLRL